MKLTKQNFLIVFLVILLTIFSWFGFKLWSFLTTPMVAKEGSQTTFIFAPGASVKKAAYALNEQKLLKYPLFFVLFVRLSGAEYNLKAGEYIIEPGTTPCELIEKMTKGKMLRHAFTIVEGWTFAQVITALNNNQYVTHTIQKLSQAEIMSKIGHAGEMPEGRFFPETYLFSGEIVDIDLLSNAYNLMQKQLAHGWKDRTPEVPYHCSYEALIVASLIEKETAKVQEKPLIAGIILRRLEKGMLLQIDPAVIYGLGNKFSGKLTKTELMKNTPYNTYLHKGLPPTPICMPGKTSLEAALHPVIGNSWYYVAKGDGTHKFSESLKEQSRAIKKYLLRK